jgi:hypothetical protein
MFLFGALLIVARFVTIIGLLILSSLAFATYLIPSWATMGWSAWWTHLIKNALLAPVIMLFIWASITISTGLKQTILAKGSLGGAIADPTTTTAILGYLTVLGLFSFGLFLAYKLSTASALRFVTAIPAIGLGLATAGVGNIFARSSAQAARRYQQDFDNAKTPEEKAAALRRKNRNERWANRDWNLMNTTAAKFAAKALPGLGVGGFKTTPYGKARDEKVKAIVENAGKASLTSKQAGDIRKEASAPTTGEETQKRTLEEAKKQTRIASERANRDEQFAADQHRLAERQMREAREARDGIETELRNAETELARNNTPANQARRDQLDQQLRGATDTIRRAEGQVTSRSQYLTQVQERAAAARATHETQESTSDTGVQRIKNAQELRGAQAVQNYNDALVKYATRFSYDPNVNAAAREKLVKYHGDHDVQELFKKFKEQAEKAAPSTSSAPTSSSPSPAPTSDH